MNREYEIQRILESKRVLRRKLAALPIKEKLAMLDVLRDRLLSIRKAAALNRSVLTREHPPEYKTDAGK
ncbi:hypothetical protein JW906_01490 [bacterium]|nr:hypothetical protein [bacterium]